MCDEDNDYIVFYKIPLKPSQAQVLSNVSTNAEYERFKFDVDTKKAEAIKDESSEFHYIDNFYLSKTYLPKEVDNPNKTKKEAAENKAKEMISIVKPKKWF